MSSELGSLRSGGESRDAVHVAIFPIVCGEEPLMPGERIKLKYYYCDIAVPATADDAMGIVDPLLKQGLKKGDESWMVLYPNTVKNLRHNWDHPNIESEAEKASGDDDDYDSCSGC